MIAQPYHYFPTINSYRVVLLTPIYLFQVHIFSAVYEFWLRDVILARVQLLVWSRLVLILCGEPKFLQVLHIRRGLRGCPPDDLGWRSLGVP